MTSAEDHLADLLISSKMTVYTFRVQILFLIVLFTKLGEESVSPGSPGQLQPEPSGEKLSIGIFYLSADFIKAALSAPKKPFTQPRAALDRQLPVRGKRNKNAV